MQSLIPDNILVALYALYDYLPGLICNEEFWHKMKFILNSSDAEDAKKEYESFSREDTILLGNIIHSYVKFRIENKKSNHRFESITDNHRKSLMKVLGIIIIRDSDLAKA